MIRPATSRVSTSPRRAAKRKAAEPTREKLIEAAGLVFAERGYRDATIREICRRARANVAAVNYTFGDKLGLYTEVLRESFRGQQLAAMTAALDPNLPPEQTLRGIIRARLMSLCGRARPDWSFRIVMHEFSHPTPAIARVVEGLWPVYERMRKATGEILGLPVDHETTRLCVNSIVGQVIFYAISKPVLSRLQPELKLTPEQLERVASHIAEFSLAYLKNIGQAKSHG